MNDDATPAKVRLTDGLGLAPERAGQPRMMTIIDGAQEDETGHWYSPAAVREMLDAEAANLRAALKWYADGEHFTKAQPDAWDTVSGEPQNWWCDEAGTAMIEDGTLAGMVLAGKLTGAQLGALEDGEVVKA